MVPICPVAHPPSQAPDHPYAAWLIRDTTAVRQQCVGHDIRPMFSYARYFTLCYNYCIDVADSSTPNHLALLWALAPMCPVCIHGIFDSRN
jgi:hypothetical protein